MTDSSYQQRQLERADYFTKLAQRSIRRGLASYDNGDLNMFRATVRNAAENEAKARACKRRANGEIENARLQVPGVVDREVREGMYQDLKELAGSYPDLEDDVRNIDIYEEESGFD